MKMLAHASVETKANRFVGSADGFGQLACPAGS